MFKNLANFKRKRTVKEAVGFYLAFLLIGILLGVLAGSIGGILTGGNSLSFQLGNIGAIIFCLTLSFLILQKKKLMGHFGFLLLAIVSGIIAIYGGCLFGLIPVAYLTTR